MSNPNYATIVRELFDAPEPYIPTCFLSFDDESFPEDHLAELQNLFLAVLAHSEKNPHLSLKKLNAEMLRFYWDKNR